MNNQLLIASTSIRQFNKFYSLNDLHAASGRALKNKPSNFLRIEKTQELIHEIERGSDMSIAVKVRRGGDFQGTFACKEIIYAYAMWVSPAFMLKVIRAYDNIYSESYSFTINAAQQQQIKQAVGDRHYLTGETHQFIYHKLYSHFQIPKYQDLPASKFDEAIEFLGGSLSRPYHQLTDDELCSLSWLYKASEVMRSRIEAVYPALKVLHSDYAASFYTMSVEYQRTLENARIILERETRHILLSRQGWRESNWSNVLPFIRKQEKLIY